MELQGFCGRVHNTPDEVYDNEDFYLQKQSKLSHHVLLLNT